VLSIHSWYTVEGTITYHQDHTCCLVFETASGNFELVPDVMARSRSGVPMDACGTQNRAVFWPFGKRVMELLILDKKERVAESQ